MITCEDELIQSAAHGDQEAFRQLWEAHHAVAMAAAQGTWGEPSLAERIDRFCGTQVAIEDERLMLVR